MEILIYFRFFILISTAKASARPKYYFLKDGMHEMKVDDLQSETGTRISRIVVDFGSTYYLYRVIANETEIFHPRIVTSYYVNTTTFIDKLCIFDKVYYCKGVSRILVIEGEDVNRKYNFDGHYTHVENYIGCYSTNLDTTTMKESSIELCQSICRSDSFYGISQTRCLCINDTSKLMPVNLELCRSSCHLLLQHCGSNIYFSLYSMERDVKSNDPSWECIYNNKSCPVCPKGRKGISCEIIDCLENNGSCEESNCQSTTYSGYINVAMCICEKGFYTDQTFKCKDIDECLALPCGGDRSCFNSIGSFSCRCKEGFDDIKSTCVDHDECSANPCGVNMNCLNSPGTYSCFCQTGFLFKDSICEDVDECTLSESCDESTTNCENFPGDYECLCKKGYTRMEFKSRKSQCQDEDECFQEDKCPSGVVCLNLIGSYDCVCPNGTKKQTYTHTIECEEIDECEIPDICDQTTSFCLNTIRSYICACRLGYVPINNYTCVLSDQVAKENTSKSWEDNYSTEAYDEGYDDIFEVYYTYAFGLFVVLILGTIFISLLCRSKKSPSSRVSSLTSVSN